MQSELQKLFMRRLAEEMESRALGANAAHRMAKRMGYTISQSTISRILAGLQDPTLEKLHALADVLGMPPWALLMEPGQIEQRVIRPIAASRQNVVRLPDPYPKIFQNKEEKITERVRTRYKKK